MEKPCVVRRKSVAEKSKVSPARQGDDGSYDISYYLDRIRVEHLETRSKKRHERTHRVS